MSLPPGQQQYTRPGRVQCQAVRRPALARDPGDLVGGPLVGERQDRGSRARHDGRHALAPQPGDIRVHKPRYSAFFNSQLDSILRARGIKTIVFVGIATNVCVESTLRDGFHLEYFCVMLEDATHHLGPDFLQAATVYNVEKFFGWVSTAADFCGAVGQIGED